MEPRGERWGNSKKEGGREVGGKKERGNIFFIL